MKKRDQVVRKAYGYDKYYVYIGDKSKVIWKLDDGKY